MRKGARGRVLLTLADQEVILGIREDIVGLDHRRYMTGADGGIVGGGSGIPRRGREDAEGCDQREACHGGWERGLGMKSCTSEDQTSKMVSHNIMAARLIYAPGVQRYQ